MFKKILAISALVILCSSQSVIFAKAFNSLSDSTDKTYPEIKYNNSDLYSESDRTMINSWFPHYYSLRNALATDNSADARKYGLELIDAINGSMSDLRSNNSTSAPLTTFSSSLSDWRDKYSSTSDLAEQRRLFSLLNENMVPFLRSSGMNYNVYVMYCPDDVMYSNSVWFSDALESGNPYMGSSGKSNCTMVKESWIYSK